MLTALRMVDGLDAGPVYLKEALSLDGLAEEIYARASELAASMILRIVRNELTPVPQVGEPTVFQRRHPVQSSIPACADLRGLFDFLRMLDAEGYPRAFLVYEGFRYEFSRPALYEGRIVADVRITADPENTPT
jgi:methionyl-tRNA formyltransferase